MDTRKLVEAPRRLLNTISKRSFSNDLSKFAEGLGGDDRFFGFNRQRVRTTILLRILQELPFDAFIETGTNKASTTLLMAAQTKLPIYSCDIDPAQIAAARRKLIGYSSRVDVRCQDSREFLKDVLREGKFQSPFFYLDAHWYELPLVEELELVVSMAPEFAIVIDDFRVPSDESFGYDSYFGQVLELGLIEEALSRATTKIQVFFPAYPAARETGSKRGFVLLASPKFAKAIQEMVPASLLSVWTSD